MEKRAFKNYGKIDIIPFKTILEKNKLDWDKYDYRQKKFDVHSETKSLPLIFSEEQYKFKKSQKSITEIVESSKTEFYPLFADVLENINNHLKDLIDEDGFIFRAVLVNLPAGKVVKPHFDKGKSFEVPRRVHVVIKTNEKCFFTVGDKSKNLKEGEVWEIDNSGRKHSVINDGDEDRIHLIADFLNSEELTEIE